MPSVMRRANNISSDGGRKTYFQGVYVMVNSATRSSSHMGTAAEHTEGTVARAIEHQTAKLPSDLFLWAAGGSILGSLTLQFMGYKRESLFVGQWAPTFLILGLYNKLVKVAGSDQLSRGSSEF
jgi:hypothetical protein